MAYEYFQYVNPRDLEKVLHAILNNQDIQLLEARLAGAVYHVHVRAPKGVVSPGWRMIGVEEK